MTDDVSGGARLTARRIARTPTPWFALIVALACFGMTACWGSKAIRHYQPRVVTEMMKEANFTNEESDIILAIEDFSTSPAYDEQRIVYRASPYRFDYYHYHRWSSPPGLLVADLMRQVYQATGAFEAVVGYSSSADVVLNGRVVAFEEVDHTDKWQARVTLDLQLRDAMSGRMLWNERIDQLSTLDEKSPTGLAAAMSRAMTKIGVRTTPPILQAARTRKQQNRRHRPSRSPRDNTDTSESSDTSGNGE